MAFALAMDAFAVSVSSGMTLCRARFGQMVKIGASFGFFQGLMPIIGYTIALTFAEKIQAIDHWIAFGLLVFIGGKMLWEVFHSNEEEPAGDPTNWKTLLVMSIATSIDALAVGASLAVMPKTGLLTSPYGFLLCVLIIAVVTLVLCVGGVKLGCCTGKLFGRKAEILGGVVLILIGVKTLLEHTLFA